MHGSEPTLIRRASPQETQEMPPARRIIKTFTPDRYTIPADSWMEVAPSVDRRSRDQMKILKMTVVHSTVEEVACCTVIGNGNDVW